VVDLTIAIIPGDRFARRERTGGSLAAGKAETAGSDWVAEQKKHSMAIVSRVAYAAPWFVLAAAPPTGGKGNRAAYGFL